MLPDAKYAHTKPASANAAGGARGPGKSARPAKAPKVATIPAQNNHNFPDARQTLSASSTKRENPKGTDAAPTRWNCHCRKVRHSISSGTPALVPPNPVRFNIEDTDGSSATARSPPNAACSCARFQPSTPQPNSNATKPSNALRPNNPAAAAAPSRFANAFLVPRPSTQTAAAARAAPNARNGSSSP